VNPLLKKILDWRPRTPFYYGWLILGICFLATFAATAVSQVVLGGIQIFITEDTGWSKSTISLAVTAGTWSSGLLSPLIGRLADRYGPRWLMPVGITVAAAAFFSLAGVDALWQFFAAYILGRAVSNPVLIGLVPRTVAVNFFRRRRNIVLALVTSYRPVTGAINIQIFSFLAIRYGWRAAYRYMGILALVLVAPIVLFMRRRPEDIGLLPDGAKPGEPVRAGPGVLRRSGGGRRVPVEEAEFSWTAHEALRTKAFWLIVMTAVTGTLASGAVGFSMVPYLFEDVGISKGMAAGVLSLGTFLAITNLGWGYLADVFTPRRCLVVTMTGAGASVLYLITVGSLPTALVFALAFGIFSGPATPLENMILAQYFGRNSYGTIAGIYTPFQTVMLGLGPSFGSVFREVTGGYEALYVISGTLYFASALFVLLAKPPALPARALADSIAQEQ
jgi:MFS family permease